MKRETGARSDVSPQLPRINLLTPSTSSRSQCLQSRCLVWDSRTHCRLLSSDLDFALRLGISFEYLSQTTWQTFDLLAATAWRFSVPSMRSILEQDRLQLCQASHMALESGIFTRLEYHLPQGDNLLQLVEILIFANCRQLSWVIFDPPTVAVPFDPMQRRVSFSIREEARAPLKPINIGKENG